MRDDITGIDLTDLRVEALASVAPRFQIESNDEPYMPYRVKDTALGVVILSYHQDDAPVHDYNTAQYVRAQALCLMLNTLPPMMQDAASNVFKHSNWRK